MVTVHRRNVRSLGNKCHIILSILLRCCLSSLNPGLGDMLLSLLLLYITVSKQIGTVDFHFTILDDSVSEANFEYFVEFTAVHLLDE